MFSEASKIGGNLSEVILKTVAFFDLFDYPLTAYEIYYYLDKKYPLALILETLSSTSRLEQQIGFYFLSGRSEIIKIRQARHNYSLRKIKIAQFFSRLFSLLPFIKVVALANSIGQHNLRDGSDIDFFIITSAKRLWLSRLYCTGLAKILNRRPSARNKKDKLCLSFYLSEEHLNLDDLKLPTGDPYFEYWQRSLVLLYNKDDNYEKFLVANSLVGDNSEIVFENSGSFLEKLARQWQLAIMAPELKQKMNQNSGVVVNDSVLKLYLTDRRQEFLNKYEQKLEQIFSLPNWMGLLPICLPSSLANEINSSIGR